MASAAGSHLWTFHSLLMRKPIRNTTKSPSMLAVMRRSRMAAMSDLPCLPVGDGGQRARRKPGSPNHAQNRQQRTLRADPSGASVERPAAARLPGEPSVSRCSARREAAGEI